MLRFCQTSISMKIVFQSQKNWCDVCSALFCLVGFAWHVDVETGVTHQLRSWFERAVNSESAKRCALVWRLYMFFEVLCYFSWYVIIHFILQYITKNMGDIGGYISNISRWMKKKIVSNRNEGSSSLLSLFCFESLKFKPNWTSKQLTLVTLLGHLTSVAYISQ